MPLYDYKCSDCSAEFDEVRSIADRKHTNCACGGTASLIIKLGRAPSISTFRPRWHENNLGDRVWCDTPQKLRDACDRNNSYSHDLENGIYKTSPGPDPDPKEHPEAYFSE